MAKTKRLLELMLTVNARKSFTVRELANEFNVSSRTIMRDLQELGELGVPLYSEVGPHGGYRILRERVLPPISFTESEAVAIFFASESLRHYSSLPFEEESQAALSKFLHYLPDDIKKKIHQMKDRVMFWAPTRQVTSPFLQDLMEAALEQKVLTVEYDSESGHTLRKLQPIGLFSDKGYWYCPAYCFTRKEIRLFRADRMHSVNKDEDVAPNEDISRMSLDELRNPLPERTGKTVLLKAQLTRKGVRTAQSDPWLEKQIKLNRDGSGSIETKLNKHELPFYCDFFFGLGLEAKVETPQEMVEGIKLKVMEMHAHYS